jgi:hypothetical protein
MVGFVGGKIYYGLNGPQKVVIDSRPTKSDPIYVKIYETNNDKLSRDIGALRKDINELKVYSYYIGGQDNSINKSLPAKYELPKNVKGYYLAAISGIIDSTHISTAIRKGAPIIISFSLRDKNLLSAATPTIVEIVNIKSNTEVVQIFNDAFELRYGQNNIVIDADLPRGNYELRYGYYKIAELNREFPYFYSKQFNFKILE